MTATDPASMATAGSDIRVLVAGPDGRMGRVMMDGLPHQQGIVVAGGLRRGDTAAELLADVDVLVDFTHADAASELLLAAVEAGVRPVSGTSGVSEDVLAAVDKTARRRGIAAVWAPHFRLAGVLMMRLAGIAARYLGSAEIIESHHATKADAPSGTARELARMIRDAHGTELADVPTPAMTLDGVRGGVEAGVHIHSLRLPGIVGWHEVIFAGDQELLTIRHHDMGREAYVPAVARAIRTVTGAGAIGLIRGYDAIIGLTGNDRSPTR